MSADPAFTRTWQVGRYTVVLTCPRLLPGVFCASIEWAPELPLRLSAAELEQYRAGRDAALADMARELGITAAVVDL